MSPALDGCRAKLARAQEHLDALKTEERWEPKDEEPLILGKDFYPEHNLFIFKIEHIHSPRPRLSAILGDILQNLHSVLEHLAWQLVIANRGTPTDRVTSFPITRSPTYFDTTREKQLKGISATHVAIIEGLQPYPGRDADQFVLLWLLRELARKDRHQDLRPVLGMSASTSPDIYVLGDCFIRGFGVNPNLFEEPLAAGTELVYVPVQPTGPNPNVNMNIELATYLALPERVGKESVALSAEAMIRLVDGIVRMFSALIEGSGHSAHPPNPGHSGYLS
jgi:hypothetical protein